MPWTPPASPITWQDFPNLSTAVSAAHLNQMEGYAATVGQSVVDYLPDPPAGGSLPSRRRFTVSDGPKLSQYTVNGSSDLNGVVDVTTPFRGALADAAAMAVSAYGGSKGCPVLVDEGIALVSGKLQVGEGVGIRGVAAAATTIVIPNAPFADNCVISNLTQDTTQEFAFLEKFSLFGHSPSNVVQSNGGSATTFTGSTFTVTDPSVPISLQVGSTAGYASNGTLTIGGTRWIYQSVVDGTHFGGCLIVSASGATITNGAAVAPVTTNNLVGIQLANVFGGSYVRDLWVGSFTGEGILVAGRTNGFPWNNINAVHCNRDAILFCGHPQVMSFEHVMPQYSGENGSVDGDTAGLHILGPTNVSPFLGSIEVGNLYSEQLARGASALWIQNCGGTSTNVVRLETSPPTTTVSGAQTLPVATITVASTTLSDGSAAPTSGQLVIDGNVVAYTGTTGTTFTGCTGGAGAISNGDTVFLVTGQAVRIDSAQASPLTEDATHSASLSLRNVSATGPGRRTIVDNVRGNVSPITTTSGGHTITRYDTEDNSPGAVEAWLPNHFYWANAIAYNAGIPYQRLAVGFSAATFAADVSNWSSIASAADRMDALRRGTLTSYRESWDRRSGGTQAFAYTSGLLEAAVVPVLHGDSFTKAIFETHTTGATLGTNADSHWYLAVYDDATGNLIVQTADQTTTAIPASTSFSIGLQSTYTPTADAMIRIALMIYLGTGGTPAAPTLRASLPASGGALVAGLTRQAVSGTGSLTTGTAPGSFGTLSNLGNVPYLALSS